MSTQLDLASSGSGSVTSLPLALDFDRDREASPDRMNRAMLYLYLRLSAATALQPEFESAIAQLQAVGLERLDEVLAPIFIDATSIAANLDVLRRQWLTGAPLAAATAELVAQVTARLASVDGLLSASDAQIAANLLAVAAQLAAQNVAVDGKLTAQTNQLAAQNIAITNQLAGQNTAVTNQLAANLATVAAQLATQDQTVINKLAARDAAVATKLNAFSVTAKWAEATVAELLAGTAERLVSAAMLWNAQAPVALVDAATIAIDLSAGVNFAVTLAGNRTLANPTGGRPGQQGSIFVTQDATGGRVLSFASAYLPDDLVTFPTLNPAAGVVTELRYKVAAGGIVRLYGGKPASVVLPIEHPGYISGRSYGAPRSVAPGTITAGLGVIYTAPIVIRAPVTISALQCVVNSGPVSGAMAIYSNADGLPQTRLALTATMTPAAAGLATFSFAANQTLQPGVYWLAVRFTGSNCSLFCSGAESGLLDFLGTTSSLEVTNHTTGRTSGSNPGAMVTTFPTSSVIDAKLSPLMAFVVA